MIIEYRGWMRREEEIIGWNKVRNININDVCK